MHPASEKLQALARQTRVLQASAATNEQADKLRGLATLYEQQAAELRGASRA
jgi:hypothetical protein